MSNTFGKGMKSGTMPTDKGTAMADNNAIGSGSRPGGSKVMIETSQPENPHTLGRAPAGYLK